jgi:hypothetical protein
MRQIGNGMVIRLLVSEDGDDAVWRKADERSNLR